MAKAFNLEKKEMMLWIVFVTFMAIVASVIINQIRIHKKILLTLTSTKTSDMSVFKIYPGVISPAGAPVEIWPSDPLVDEFLQAIGDASWYFRGERGEESEYDFFIELALGEDVVQIKCKIPSRKRDRIVVGHLGEWGGKWGNFHYGDFQSQQLYQWYQTYKDRWLTPAAPPPGATAAPTPP